MNHTGIATYRESQDRKLLMNALHYGDTVSVIRDLKVKGSSLVVKVGTKVKASVWAQAITTLIARSPRWTINSSKGTSMKKLTATAAIAFIAFSFQAAAAEPNEEKTASGIVITRLKDGTGASPRSSDTVKVHYRGTLTNGKEFDSSYGRGQPTSFPLNRVIPCWTEGMQTMKTGGKSKLVCPPNLAYGSRGIPGTIPPDSTLVFEVELLEILK